MVCRHKNLRALARWLAACMVVLHEGAAAQALPPYSATTVDFTGFIGKIRIEPGPDKSINLQLKRGDARLLKTTLHHSVLHIIYTPKIDANESVDERGNPPLFRSGANVNQETINGSKKYGRSSVQDMAELIVRAPIDISLQANGFVGDASIDAMSGPADLTLKEGRISAKRLGPARLRIKGAGAIELGEATGEVRLNVEGAGDIQVKSGSVERLWADVNGAGNISYTGGSIQQAYVSARGVSSIKLEGVVKVSRGAIEGASEVEINSLSSGK